MLSFICLNGLVHELHVRMFVDFFLFIFSFIGYKNKYAYIQTSVISPGY